MRGLALLVLAGVLLSGCYVSGALLLDPAKAVRPVPDGDYARDKQTAARLKAQPDGSYAIWFSKEDGSWEGPGELWINPLGVAHDRRLYALAERDMGSDDFLYAVAYMDRGKVYEAAPECDNKDAHAAAVLGGASFEGKSFVTCRFTSREGLFKALSAFAKTADFGKPFARR